MASRFMSTPTVRCDRNIGLSSWRFTDRASALAWVIRFSELAADGLQIPHALCAELGIGHREVIEGIQKNLRHDQPGIVLVVGWNGIPGSVMGARCGKTLAERLPVMPPILSLVNVRLAEFPILVGRFNALHKPLRLFLLRQVQEKFDDLGAISV